MTVFEILLSLAVSIVGGVISAYIVKKLEQIHKRKNNRHEFK